MILIRWLAVTGQVIAILSAYFLLGVDLPLRDCLLVVVVSVVLNIIQRLSRPQSTWMQGREVTFSLAFDLVQLSVLLGLSGGLHNPFSLLILAPVTVSASVLERKETIFLSALAFVCISALAFYYHPIALGGEADIGAPLYLFGLWGALAVGIAFIAVYVSNVAGEARTMRTALQITRSALSREQHLSALGGLAAAAAHELGTPLGTLYVVVKDLQEQLEPEQEWMREDLDVMASEIMRCRDILKDMVARKEIDSGEPYNFLPLRSLVEDAVAPYHKDGVELLYQAQARDDSPAPVVARSPEIIHALGLIAQNAIQFTRDKVVLDLLWDEAQVSLKIKDNGQGFSASVLARLGDPCLSGREDSDSTLREERDGEHMGLGVFIAVTLLGRTGAKTDFGNHPDGGAVVSVVWSRAQLENQRED